MWGKEQLQHSKEKENIRFHLCRPLNNEMTDDAQPSRQRNRLWHMPMCYTRPSYKDKA
jgi:hypothetical protein